jgi:hypothetical protein
MKVLIGAVIFMLLPVVGLSFDRSVTVRDRYGNIVETKDRHGNDTTVLETLPEPKNIMGRVKKPSVTVAAI